jgi:signal transduction histidine kinase
MKEHNGSVEAANSPEGGSVFTVTLPVSSTG